MSQYVVEMTNIEKQFGKVRAVTNGQFNLKKGELHSLIGENGAGKATMMKLLFGMYPIDSGEIRVNDEVIANNSPSIAISHGIGMVHQEFMLVNELTVLENIILGFEPMKGSRIDFEKARSTVQEYIDKYDMDVQMDKRIDQISVGEAQRVEIIKVLARGADIIILDEPTGVLTPQEVRKLFEVLQNLLNDGKSIIFISHKLNEVMEISDRVSVMRRGEYIGTVNKAETNEKELANMMVGREVFLDIDKCATKAGDKVLEVKNIWTSGEKELSKIRNVSFDVRAGEIVGIAGVDGNGQSELAEAIAGLRKVESGSILLDHEDITNKSPKEIRLKGFAHIPEDRNKMGVNKADTVANNLAACSLDEHQYKKLNFILNESAILENAKQKVEKFDIRPTDPKIRVSTMSGGNMQKVVVAREVSLAQKFLLASQPTRGIDIGAIEAIRNILQDAKAKGVGVLLISTELEEVLSLSDRIIVLYEGKVAGIMNAEEANEDNLGILMLGGKLEDTAKGGSH